MLNTRDVETAEFPSPVLELALPESLSSKVHIDVAALSDAGKVRAGNEDHYYVARGGRHVTTLVTNVPPTDIPSQFEETAYLLVVADGMGGHAGGEVASRLAISTLINVILHAPEWIMRLEDDEHAEELMRRAVARYQVVHEVLQQRARVDPGLKGMGTTMTAAYSLGRDVFIAQVGDSRAYRFRDRTLQLLTRDQTHAQMLANEGLIRQQDVARHRLRHVLTSALGGAQCQPHVEIERATLADGDRLLLCSDGLTDMVEDGEIADILRRETRSEEACRLLVDRALANGGKDNVTVVLARYSMPD
jgi:serine/threonine protein phosphatase PrpC